MLVLQFTDRTEICSSEDCEAVRGLAVRPHLLPEVTDQTLHLPHSPPLHSVTLGLVVTEPAAVGGVAAGGDQLALPLVMAAAQHLC